MVDNSLLVEPANGVRQAVLMPHRSGYLIPINRSVLFVGSDPVCDAVVRESPCVSRKHCVLVKMEDTIVIRDLGSTNGTRVNGELVRDETALTAGDEIAIGSRRYTLTITNIESE